MRRYATTPAQPARRRRVAVRARAPAMPSRRDAGKTSSRELWENDAIGLGYLSSGVYYIA